MITCNIMGGLGNQLFQIYTTFAYGIKHNVKIIYPYYYEIANRHTYWDTFLKNLTFFTTKFTGHTITNRTLSNFEKFNESGFGYCEIPSFGDRNTLLNGYFQSYKFFDEFKEKINLCIQIPKLKVEIREKYKTYFQTDDDISIISMHFRLGDYTIKRYYHPVMSYEHFEKSLIEIMSRKIKTSKTRVLYFCEKEDNEYVLGKIHQLNQVFPEIEFVKVNDELDDWEQLIVMSLCDHHIIANSTFSWWGAYLNDSETKIVCYPNTWFGEYYEHKYDASDLFPPSWSKIVSRTQHWSEPLV